MVTVIVYMVRLIIMINWEGDKEMHFLLLIDNLAVTDFGSQFKYK